MKKESKLMTAIVILILLTIALALIFRLTIKLPPITPMKLFEKEPEHTATGEAIPGEVYTYNGVVEEVKEDHLVIMSSSSNNYVAKDIRLTVVFDSATEIIVYQLPVTVSSGSSFPPLVSENGKATDIIPGQKVMIYSRENVKDKKEFYADKIAALP